MSGAIDSDPSSVPVPVPVPAPVPVPVPVPGSLPSATTEGALVFADTHANVEAQASLSAHHVDPQSSVLNPQLASELEVRSVQSEVLRDQDVLSLQLQGDLDHLGSAFGFLIALILLCARLATSIHRTRATRASTQSGRALPAAMRAQPDASRQVLTGSPPRPMTSVERSQQVETNG